jgi:hypothetical protein
MRTAIIAAALAAGLVTGTVAAAPASATPICLISNGGHFTKSLTCVELRDTRPGVVGAGRFDAGDSGFHTLTVTVEYSARYGGHEHGPLTWVQLASVTRHGRGTLTATTEPAHAPRFAQVRACVATDGHAHRMCTSPTPSRTP